VGESICHQRGSPATSAQAQAGSPHQSG